MKKLLFCAAMVAAMSMAFVACGGSKKEDPKEQLVQKIEKICADHDVNAFNALEEEMMKYSEEDFTEKQLERIEKAYNSYRMKEWESMYPLEEEGEEADVVSFNEDEYLKEQLVQKFEKICADRDIDALEAFAEEMSQYTEEDFTDEQKERIEKAALNLNSEPKAEYKDLDDLVDKFCAACDADDMMAASMYGMELQKYTSELTQAQSMRIEAAANAYANRMINNN